MTDIIGSKVNLPGTRGHGILRYYGPVDGKPGLWGGLELVGPIAELRGKNLGVVGTKRYFDVAVEKSGLFMTWDRLRLTNTHLPALNSDGLIASLQIAIPRQRPILTSRKPSGTAVPRSPLPRPPLRPALRRILGSATPQRSPIIGSEPPKLFDVNTAVRKSPTIKDHKLYEQELGELRAQKIATERELTEKSEILASLERTVNQLQPLLEQYETQIAEQEKRLEKQKQEFERAREEWRQLVDVMTQLHQENEEFYVKQIEDLKSNAKDDSGSQLSELEAKVLELKSEDELRQSRLEMLTKELDVTKKAHLDLQRAHIELKETQKLEAPKLSSRHLELEKQVAELKDKNASLKELLAVGNTYDEVAELNVKIKLLTKENIAIKEAMAESDQLTLLEQLQKQIGKMAKENKMLKEEKELGVIGGDQDAVTKLQGLNNQLEKEILELKDQLLGHHQMQEHHEQLKLELADHKRKLDDHEQLQKQIASHKANLEDIKLRHQQELESATTKLELMQTSQSDLENRLKQEYHRLRQLQLEKDTPADDLEEVSRLEAKVEELKHELTMRPTFEELVEVQNSLDELESLHKLELELKDGEIERISSQLTAERSKSRALLAPLAAATVADISESRSTVVSMAEADTEGDQEPETAPSLPIFTPDAPVDPSMGKVDWCGLCERDGHNALNCPYENDIF